MKRTPLRRRSKAKEAKLEEERKERAEMKAFFEYLWNNIKGKKVCSVCGSPIYGENLSIYHDHLLEKHLYPEYKFEEWNMALVCLDCHIAKGNGWPKEKHLEMMEEARKFAKNLENVKLTE